MDPTQAPWRGVLRNETMRVHTQKPLEMLTASSIGNGFDEATVDKHSQFHHTLCGWLVEWLVESLCWLVG